MKHIFSLLLVLALALPAEAFFSLGSRRILGTSGGDTPAFSADLITTLVPSKCVSCTPTFTRSTSAWMQDFEGIFREKQAGSVRFEGARRVRNMVTVNSNPAVGVGAWAQGAGGGTVTANSAVAPDGTTKATTITTAAIVNQGVFLSGIAPTGRNYAFSVWLKGAAGGEVVSLGDASSRVNVTITNEWARYVNPSHSQVNSSNVIYSNTLAQTFYAWGAQLEEVTGQANQNPSEYVSVGVLSAPFHGAGVDGVKYFDTQSSCTVTSNVVTGCGAGSAISASTLKGYIAEGARTTYAIWTNDLTNAAWVKTTMNTAFTSTGPSGIPNNATRLTATAGNATALQSITRASAQRVTGVFLKRITGTGTINITQDNGAIWTPVTITSSWALYTLPADTLVNPIIGIQIVTNGDAVDATWWQHEEAAYISSPLPNNSATTSVTRNADVLQFPVSGNFPTNNVTKTLTFTPASTGGTRFLWGSYVDADNYTAILHDGTNMICRKRISATNYDATRATTLTAGTAVRVGCRFSSTSGIDVFVNGVQGTNHVNTTALQLGTNFGIGADGNGTNQAFGNIKQDPIYKKALPDATMQRLTQ